MAGDPTVPSTCTEKSTQADEPARRHLATPDGMQAHQRPRQPEWRATASGLASLQQNAVATVNPKTTISKKGLTHTPSPMAYTPTTDSGMFTIDSVLPAFHSTEPIAPQ